MLKKGIKTLLLVAMLLTCNMAARADEDIIEHEGDHYIINVDALHPDSEMTLMDVLNMCPEFVSANGGNLGANYVITVDEIDHYIDAETFFLYTKASEVSSITVFNSASVLHGYSGGTGLISVTYKQPDPSSTSGKVALEGSTYGNGKLYADFATQQKNVTVRGSALTNLQYAKGSMSEGGWFSSRHNTENAHLSLDWDISPKDNLKIRAYQQFFDHKERYNHDDPDESFVTPMMEHYVDLTARYTRALSSQGAELIVEGGGDYLSMREDGERVRDSYPYLYTEVSIPCLNDDLQILAGWEIDYDNYWTRGSNRRQILENNIYVQLSYSHGPWTFTLGDRLNILGFWQRSYHPDFEESQLTRHHNNNYLSASVGYSKGRHRLLGSIGRDTYIPGTEDFYSNIMGNTVNYIIPIQNTLWRSELRYTYQRGSFSWSSSVHHSWRDYSYSFSERLTGIRTSVTWHKGPLRITAGADYVHDQLKYDDDGSSLYDNYYNLKLSPTLLLGKGFRLSSTLLYRSRQKFTDRHAHLLASVKLNKDLGRHCNVYADFRNLAGMPTVTLLQAEESFYNRALTLGMNIYF